MKVLIVAPMTHFVLEEAVRLGNIFEVHLELPSDLRYRHLFSYIKNLSENIPPKIHVHIAPYVDLRTFLSFLRFLRFYPSHALARNPLLVYSEIRRARNSLNIVRLHNINIIHSHFAYQEGFVGYLSKNSLKRKKLIVTLHGNDILTEPSVGYGIRLDKRYDIIVKKVLEIADAIIVASKAVFNEVVKLSNKSVDKIYLIPNGVDINKFNPNVKASVIRDKLHIEDKFVVFTARHHRPVYGIEFLIKAIPFVLKERKDVVFVIGGDGPLRSYHDELAFKLGIRDKVVFTGHVPFNEMPLYYATSDVVVVPSLQEAWGLIVTEAMACGKPVIGTRVGGIVDQVIDGFNGFLVPPRDHEAIAKKILYLLENPSEMKRMGLNGRRLAEERFNIEKRIDKIVKIYKKLVENKK